MSQAIQPIVITPEQIVALATELASQANDGADYSDADWQHATYTWLRRNIAHICGQDSIFYAFGEGWQRLPAGFEIKATCDMPGCHRKPLEDDFFCKYHREEEDARSAAYQEAV